MNYRRLLLVPLAMIVVSCAAPNTPAPVARIPGGIELKNGTVIVGKIRKEEGGKVYIEADFLGSIVIDSSALVRSGK